jgi:hypothetical protein
VSPEFDNQTLNSVSPEHLAGKYFSLEAPIWSLTIELILENKDSSAIDHFEGNSLVSLLAI